jgi:hypothetical protein
MFRTEDEVRERARAYAGGAIAAPNEAVREVWAALHTILGGEDLIGDGSTEGDAPSQTIAPRRGERRVEQREPVSDTPQGDPVGTAAIGRVQERQAQGRENVGDQDAIRRDRERADQEMARREAELRTREDDVNRRENELRDRAGRQEPEGGAAEPTGAQRAGTER